MARLYHSGGEIYAATGAANIGPDGGQSASITRDTSVFRSGAASWKCDSGAGNVASACTISDAVGNLLASFTAANSPYYCRVYIRATAAPATTVAILRLGSANGPTANLTTGGAIQLFANSAVQGSPSAVISDGAWHRVELSGTLVSTNWTAAELRVDGVSVATWSGSTSMGSTTLGWGLLAAPGANYVINTDDVGLNDSTGAANNSWCGDGKVVLLKPTGDSAIGAGWTGGAGGTSSLFDAVDNTPPVGVADPGTNTSQIRNATSNANANYDATMTTYTAAGIGASDTVNALQQWVITAAPVTTSAKLGGFGIVSNPAVTLVNLADTGTIDAFWSGTTAGTFTVGWKYSPGTMTETPVVTKGTAPVARVQQITASTRIAMVCFMGIYVDYTPAAVTTVPKARLRQIPGVAVRGAALR